MAGSAIIRCLRLSGGTGQACIREFHADAVEHGFAGEVAAEGDAVDAVHEGILLPDFEAVGVTGGESL
jgi:hypothetical protein